MVPSCKDQVSHAGQGEFPLWVGTWNVRWLQGDTVLKKNNKPLAEQLVRKRQDYRLAHPQGLNGLKEASRPWLRIISLPNVHVQGDE